MFAAYKLGLLYQLFHKVGCYMVTVTVPSGSLSTRRLQMPVIGHCLSFVPRYFFLLSKLASIRVTFDQGKAATLLLLR